MQKQPNTSCCVEYAHQELPADFPVIGIGKDKHVPSDEKVTRLHFHNCLEIGYCYGGAGIFIIDDKILPFSNGDVSIIFKNQIHIAQSEKGKLSQWKFVSLDPELLLNEINVNDLAYISSVANGSPEFLNILSCEKYPEIIQLVFTIISELENRHERYQAVVKGLVWVLLMKLGRIVEHKHSMVNESANCGIMRIAPALEYISKNYIRSICVAELSSLCNTSVTNFRRLFNASMSLSPLEYITRVRIKMASILLNDTDYPVLDISMKVGYSSLSSFNRHFKRIMGLSPREWRLCNKTTAVY